MARTDWYCEDLLSGKMPVEIIWEDDLVMAFYHPPFPKESEDVHALVIPKRHVTSALSPEALDGALLTAMMTAVQKVAAALGIDKTDKGFYVRFNAAAPGVTPHLHWHIKAPIPVS
ncbi:MAG: HIT domain-containing protein [Dehalococcoidales bacterium]|jgi:histidine triad (HIT) family protein